MTHHPWQAFNCVGFLFCTPFNSSTAMSAGETTAAINTTTLPDLVETPSAISTISTISTLPAYTATHVTSLPAAASHQQPLPSAVPPRSRPMQTYASVGKKLVNGGLDTKFITETYPVGLHALITSV